MLPSIYCKCCRRARKAERGYLRVLPRALHRHHLHYHDPAADPLLLLQPDRALPPHIFHGCAGLHPPARLGGEAITR